MACKLVVSAIIIYQLKNVSRYTNGTIDFRDEFDQVPLMKWITQLMRGSANAF